MAKSSSSASKKQKLDHLDAFRRGIPFVSCSALAAILNKVEQEGVPELHGRKNIKQAVLEKIAAMAGDCGSLLKQLTAVRIDGSKDMFAQKLWNPVHGIVMKSTDALFVFHWTLHVFLQDGSAQKQTFANRQGIGSRVCMLCKNIFNVRREGDDDDEGKISSRHLTLSSCDLASDSELLQSWDRLAAKAGTERKEALEKAVQAGWGPVMRPKFHWTLHLDGCYEKQGFLPACWVLEAARKYGSASSNTIRFDTSLLEEVTAEHLSVMGKEEGFHLRAHLLQPHACTAKLKKSLVQYNVLRQEGECMTSTMTRLKHGAIIKKGDMVLHGSEPGHECPYRCAKVHCCIELHNIALVMLAPATFLQQRWDMNMLKFREEAGDPQIYIIGADDLLCSVVYNKANDGTLTVLPPAYLRYLELWQLPGANKQGHLKCTASEVLGLLKPLQHYFTTCCLQEEVQPAKASLLAWLHVLELLNDQNQAPLRSRQLLLACEEALEKAVQAGWGPVMRPKFHWTLHLDGCYEKQGFVPACWVLEAARKYGSASSNTIRFDTSLLEEVTAEHLSVMGKEEGFHLRAHLLQPHACTAKLKKSLVQYNVLRQEGECMTSTMTRLKHGAIIKKGDMVLHGSEPGHECPYRCAKVHCCIELHNIALVMLAPATFLQQRWDMNMLKFREEAGDPQIYIIGADDLLCSVVYNKANDGTLTVLPPAYLRPRHA
ncbi:unnamed protein product [Symbiodinium sp. CCMP2592]|nr:unnamed protein product [Symbiodinium sp. CCMP2592]